MCFTYSQAVQITTDQHHSFYRPNLVDIKRRKPTKICDSLSVTHLLTYQTQLQLRVNLIKDNQLTQIVHISEEQDSVTMSTSNECCL